MEVRLAELERQMALRESTNKALMLVLRGLIAVGLVLFAIGGWAGVIQYMVIQQDKLITQALQDVKANELRIRSTEQVQAANSATNAAKLDAITASVNRIERQMENNK